MKNTNIPKICLSIFLLLFSFTVLASQLPPTVNNAEIQSCFTLGNHCSELIIDAIKSANKSILVQAYSFTSKDIMKALIKAHDKGVKVKVILDKSQYNHHHYTSSTFLHNYLIPVWIDYKPRIAYNKIMIIDNDIVITGSYNFTKSAEHRNAENLLVIYSKKLAKIYKKNWYKRLHKSITLDEYRHRTN